VSGGSDRWILVDYDWVRGLLALVAGERCPTCICKHLWSCHVLAVRGLGTGFPQNSKTMLAAARA
jgi:hypothetical protein